MIEVPVRVYEMRDRIATEAVCRLQDSRPSSCDSRINEDLAVFSGQDRDVSTRALQDSDVPAELVNLNARLGSFIAEYIDDILCLGKSL